MNAKVCLACVGLTAAACATEKTTYVPAPRPGAPAYWESNVPAEPVHAPPGGARPDAGAGDDDAPPPEKFLWQDGTMLPPPAIAPPPSQVPMREQLPTAPLGGSNDDVYESPPQGERGAAPAEPRLP